MVLLRWDLTSSADEVGEESDQEPYRGTSLIRNTHPPRITIGP